MNRDDHSASDPLVTVCVIAYNQRQYIRDCLDGIVSQRTNFPVEVLVRDDYSTDGTERIVAEYAQQHPTLIRQVNAAENIGANKGLQLLFAQARGKYVALCEGDDYWIDDQKLSKQVACMEADSSCAFSGHRAYILGSTGDAKPAFDKGGEPVRFNLQEVLSTLGQYAPTASFLIRREALGSLPAWFSDAPVADFFLAAYALTKGRGLFLPDLMSVYRLGSIGSWTSEHSPDRPAKVRSFAKAMKRCLEKMQAEPRFQNSDFRRRLAAASFSIATTSLTLSEFQEFRAAIEMSVRACPRLSATQSALHLLRRLPQLAQGVFLVKQGIALPKFNTRQ